MHEKSKVEESFFPYFLWVVRDFTLRMVDKHGEPITEKEYLDHAVQDLKGVSDSVEQKNKTRRRFRQFFKERDCATFVRPTEQ